MKVFLIILALLLAVILQTTLLPSLTILGVAPNLVLVLLLVLVIFKGFRKIWLGIVLVGLFLDFFSGLPFGLISLALVATVYLIDWFNKNFFSAIKFWIVASSIVLGTLIYNLFLVSLTKLFQIDLIIGFKYLFLETVYNLLITVIFFYALKRNFE